MVLYKDDKAFAKTEYYSQYSIAFSLCCYKTLKVQSAFCLATNVVMLSTTLDFAGICKAVGL